MKKIEEISHNPLTDRVIVKIQELIWRGDVLPDDYLPSQHELAQQFGVGLSTIREAVKALSLLGLVDARAGRGTRVLPDALKILTRLATHRASSEDIVEIEEAIQEMQAAIDNSEEFVRADIRFHMAVARASKNEVLAQTYYLISSLLEEVVRQADELPGGKSRALANHSQILEGIKTHQPELALAAAERQIADAIEYYKKKD